MVWHTVDKAEIILGEEITSAGDKEGALKTSLRGYGTQSLRNGQHLYSLESCSLLLLSLIHI